MSSLICSKDWAEYRVDLFTQIEKYVADGTLSKVHLAFSRDQKEKIYVQHLMQQNKDELWRILEDGGHIYVCG